MDPPSRIPEANTGSSLCVRGSPNSSPMTSSKPFPRRGLPAVRAGKENHKDQMPFMPLEEIQPEDTLGQFSYAPATQTTVVTTTTTTTTKFPPLRVKAPQHLRDLDPKQYPLASSPTPVSIRRLHFEVAGRPALFQEADDTLATLEKVCITPREPLPEIPANWFVLV